MGKRLAGFLCPNSTRTLDVKIFWDTNLFIYLWEKKAFIPEMAALTDFIESGRHTLATSTLTLSEILVHPVRSGAGSVASQYLEAMQQLLLIPFEQDAAIRFANLRAENPALRPPDAIQLACAMTERCQLFITNDNRLTSVTGMTNLKVQSLTDWMNNPS